MIIIHDKKKYRIENEKLIYILEKLEQRKIKEEEIKLLMHKYNLYDEGFLENINKLWWELKKAMISHSHKTINDFLFIDQRQL